MASIWGQVVSWGNVENAAREQHTDMWRVVSPSGIRGTHMINVQERPLEAP